MKTNLLWLEARTYLTVFSLICNFYIIRLRIYGPTFGLLPWVFYSLKRVRLLKSWERGIKPVSVSLTFSDTVLFYLLYIIHMVRRFLYIVGGNQHFTHARETNRQTHTHTHTHTRAHTHTHTHTQRERERERERETRWRDYHGELVSHASHIPSSHPSMTVLSLTLP
jgi:hypothetical protein